MIICQNFHVYEKDTGVKLCTLHGLTCPRIGETLSIYDEDTRLIKHCEVKNVGHTASIRNADGDMAVTLIVETKEICRKKDLE